jgi:Tfp pilus assembly protein FimT
MRTPRFLSGGWTLVELAVVLVVVVVLGYFVVRGLRPAEALALQQAERLRDDLRYAQTLAMTRGAPYQVKVTGAAPGACPAGGAAYYWVIACTVVAADPCTGSPNTPITDPRQPGNVFCVALESGLALGGTDLYFDAMGRPRTGAALIAANHVFQITGGGTARNAAVTPITGFVTAQ